MDIMQKTDDLTTKFRAHRRPVLWSVTYKYGSRAEQASRFRSPFPDRFNRLHIISSYAFVYTQVHEKIYHSIHYWS